MSPTFVRFVIYSCSSVAVSPVVLTLKAGDPVWERLVWSMALSLLLGSVLSLLILPPYRMILTLRKMLFRLLNPEVRTWEVSVPLTSQTFFESNGASEYFKVWREISKAEGAKSDERAILTLDVSKNSGLTFRKFGAHPFLNIRWEDFKEIVVSYRVQMELVDGELSEVGYESVTFKCSLGMFEVVVFDDEGLAKMLKAFWPEEVSRPSGNLFTVHSPYV